MTATHAAAHLYSLVVRSVPSSALLVILTATPVAAQRAPSQADSARAVADSLAARLRRAEESIATLQQQMADQASAGVTTKSRMQLELTGRVLVHAFSNNARVNNVDDPQFVRLEQDGAGTPLGLTIRQTTLGGVLTASNVLGGQFAGDIDVDFFGGQFPSSGGRTFPLLRIRTARGMVRWANGSIMVGQESPLIAGLNPVSPAAIGTPAFATAGNLWLWLPQVRASVETPGSVRLVFQAAVLSSITGDPVGTFETDVDAAEHTGRPANQARVGIRWGQDVASEIGCGGHLAWIDLSSASTVKTYAGACDARIVAGRAELRAEAYTGRGLRGLGGGGIGQNLARSGSPLDDKGGWAQLNLEASSVLRLGGGCGIDVPRAADVPLNGRTRNRACAGYAIARPSGPLFIGAEFRHIATNYGGTQRSGRHLNLSAGFEF